MFELEDSSSPALIKVFGIGGGGCNAVDYMLEQGVKGVEFVCANTDLQVLEKSRARTLQLGENITSGLGAGADPERGREATLESREQILEELKDAHMVFIAAGMGGGTGTGGAPVVAEVARELGILSVAVITRPFEFEGQGRQKAADQGIVALGEHVDSLIVIANERLRQLAGDGLSIRDAFAQANEVLYGAVRAHCRTGHGQRLYQCGFRRCAGDHGICRHHDHGLRLCYGGGECRCRRGCRHSQSAPGQRRPGAGPGSADQYHSRQRL